MTARSDTRERANLKRKRAKYRRGTGENRWKRGRDGKVMREPYDPMRLPGRQLDLTAHLRDVAEVAVRRQRARAVHAENTRIAREGES